MIASISAWARRNQTMPFWHRPLLPLAAAFALGIAGRSVYPGLDPWALGLMTAAAVWTGWRLCSKRSSRGGPLLLFGTLGFLTLAPLMPRYYPPHHLAHYTDGASYHIVGRVDQAPRPTPDGRLRLVLQVTERGLSPDTLQPAAGKLRLTVYGDAPPIHAGDRLAFKSRLRSIRSFRNPGGFDYRRYLAYRQIAATAWSRGTQLQLVAADGEAKPWLEPVRSHCRQFIAAELTGDAQAVMRALTIGDRQGISMPLREVFNRLGIGHLLAISGLHVGIIAIVLLGILKWGFHRFDFFLHTGRGHAAAVGATIPVIVAYGMVAGMAPSTQRAVIMVSLGLGAYLVRRKGDTLNLIALAGLLILTWHPPMLFTVGFQLSFAAVLAIVLGLRHAWPQRPAAPAAQHRKVGFRLLVFMAVTFYATAGTLPLLMYYFQQISLIGLVSNLVAVPLIGFAALPLGLLSLALLPFSVTGASVCLQLGGLVLDGVIGVGRWAAAFERAALGTFQPTGLEIGGYYLLVAALVAIRSHPRAKWMLAVALMVLMADAGYWYHYRFSHRDLRLTVLDVGQGSAALLEFPGGETMLVDGGGYADNRVFDMGRSVVAPFLRRHKILAVDYLVLSHPSSDHMNGLVHVVQHFQPDVLIWNHDRVASESARRFRELIAREGVRNPPFEDLAREFDIGGATVRIINPPADFANRHEREGWRGLNNNSIVLQVSFEGQTILLPGDIEQPAERALRRTRSTALRSSVMLAPHHGSRSSSSRAFLEAVEPAYAIFSCGWRNRFGFPHPEVLARYRQIGSRIWRTDLDGAVQVRVRSDGQLRLSSRDREMVGAIAPASEEVPRDGSRGYVLSVPPKR